MRNISLFFLLFLITGCVSQPMPSKPVVVGLEIDNCEIGIEDFITECGQMMVYENRQLKSGRVIPINFIRVRAKDDTVKHDVAFALTGGPGAAATANPAGQVAQTRFLDDRDLVLVDQRGTGGSNPLDCIKYDLEQHPETFVDMFESAFFDPVRYKACKDRLSQTADLTQYTSSIIADDINDLRDALGYQTMTLLGGSYGTTLGLEIIRRHDQYVRAASFRGVLPPALNQTETLARDLQVEVEALFVACEEDTACNGAFPTFRQDFADVLASVAQTPVTVTLPHTHTKVPTDVRVQFGELITAIRYAFYSTQLSAGLPLSVSEAKAGDYRRLTQLLPTLLYQLSNSVYEGMWASVRCAEEFPFLDEAKTRKLSEGTVIGTERLESGKAICAFWPRGNAAANFHEPVISDTPVLLLAGSADASTPAWMAQEAVQHLRNGRLVIIPNRSHWGLGGGCIEDFVSEFIKTADVSTLDEGCVSDFTRPPFALPE